MDADPADPPVPPAPHPGNAMAMPDLLAFALRRAASSALGDLQAILDEDDLRPIQLAILAMLGARPGVRQSQLSPALGIRRTNLVPLLTELEARGLCERRPVPGDRRAAALFLTESGAGLRARCERRALAHDASVSARLGASGRQQLMSLLHRLADPAFDPPS